MSDSAFIPRDGYTKEGYVAAVPGLHPAVRFHYRPMVGDQSIHWRDGFLLKPTETRKLVPAAALSDRHLVSWDIKHPTTGELVPVSLENITRLQPRVLERMFMIVTGFERSDEDPDRARPDEQALNTEADLSGVCASLIEQERDAKNYSAASSHS